MSEASVRILDLLARAAEEGDGDALIRRLVAEEAGGSGDVEELRAAVRLLRDVSGMVARAAGGDREAQEALEQVREILARADLG
jgi:hypothetical protein